MRRRRLRERWWRMSSAERAAFLMTAPVGEIAYVIRLADREDIPTLQEAMRGADSIPGMFALANAVDVVKSRPTIAPVRVPDGETRLVRK